MLKKITYAGSHNNDEQYLFGRIDLSKLKKATNHIRAPYYYSYYCPKKGAYSKRGKYDINKAKKAYRCLMVNCVLYDEEEKYVNVVFNVKEL